MFFICSCYNPLFVAIDPKSVALHPIFVAVDPKSVALWSQKKLYNLNKISYIKTLSTDIESKEQKRKTRNTQRANFKKSKGAPTAHPFELGATPPNPRHRPNHPGGTRESCKHPSTDNIRSHYPYPKKHWLLLMDDSLYKDWINQPWQKRAGQNPKSPPNLPKTPCKCVYFVTKAFSLIEFTVWLFHPHNNRHNRSRTCLHVVN